MSRASMYPLAAAQRVRAVATQGQRATHAQRKLDETAAAAALADATARVEQVQTQLMTASVAVATTTARALTAQATYAARLRHQLAALQADVAAAQALVRAARARALAQQQHVISARADEQIVDRHHTQWQATQARTRAQRDEP